MKRKALSSGLAGLVTAAVAAVVIPLAGGSPATAAPGSPTVPQPGDVVFTENFENGLASGQVTTLLDYAGATGMTYTAEGEWALPTAWNGIVLDPTSTDPDIAATGAAGGYAQMRALAQSLGGLNGGGNGNHAVTAYTAGDPGPDLIEFATEGPIAPTSPVSNRFLTFSVNVASINCFATDPLFNFFFDDGTTEIPLNDDVINACANGDGASTFIADAPVLWTAAANPSVVLRNANGSGGGNDHAYDDIRVLDVSPQLDKQFVPAVTSAGSTARVRFTVTNTDELAAKPGWSFTDGLPLPIAADPNFATTCTDGAITAGGGAGDTSISLAGDLDAGQTHCTFEFDVVTPSDAEEGDNWTNGPGDLSDVVGLKPPAPATVAIGERLFGECADLVTFDSGPESWRVASTSNGTTPNAGFPDPIGWSATEGNPGGALTTNDVDGTWTEIWSPELAANGFTADYSFLDGELMQFDYRNDTGIGFNLYLSIRGNNGDQIWYNFAPQITDSQAWNRVRVPMDAAEWHTGFSGSTGTDLSSPAPTQAEFEAILGSVERFVVSAEGRVGQDLTFLDNFGQPCDDLGDAPASYGTQHGPQNGPSHRIEGFDPASGTAPLMLGSVVDIEDDGAPSADADGDDTAGTDDEDAVALPIAVRSGEQTTATVQVTNTSATPATLAGWLDLNDDGVFQAGERVTVPVPASSGTADYAVTFPVMASEAETFARFRVFSGTVAEPLPTGPANGGEVEDHVVEIADPAMTLEKSATLSDSNGNNVADVGEAVSYSFTVENTGNVTLTDIAIDDPRLTDLPDPALASLAPGQTETVGPYTYWVTQPDVDAGEVYNSATASGTDPWGDETDTPPSEVTVPTPERVPGLSVTKSGQLDDRNGNGLADAGEKITYSFDVRNTGNVTMRDISVVDSKVTGLTPNDFDLVPAASQVVTADPYTVTRDDVARGSVDNVATATGTDPMGGQLTSPESRVSTRTAGSDLPSTGSDVGLWAAGLGLLLLLAGGGAAYAGRPRRQGQHV